ncbi:MAG TPA: thioredoxin fold domain-containing protein [Chitinophagaceae bacterium]|nr:thioredoxin fold domain-containing protein [Chitinophagaceae bacterium]
MKTGLIFFIFCAISLSGLAQTQPDPPYKRFPTVPPLKLLLPDSSTIFTDKDLKKNTPLFFILFSPDCEHCQKETEEIIDKIDSFKNIQIVMATFMPVDKMKAFYDNYKLSRFSNIIVGYDMQYMLATYYRISYTPFLAFYDKKGNLIDGIQGALPITKVLEYFRE